MINKIDQASYGQQHALSIYMYHGHWDNPEEAKGMVSDFEKPTTTLKLSEWPWTPWVDKSSRKSSVARMCTLSRCASLKPLIDPIVLVPLLCVCKSAVSNAYASVERPKVKHGGLRLELFCELGHDLSLISQMFYATGKECLESFR